MYDANSASLHTQLQIRWEALQCEEKFSQLHMKPDRPHPSWFDRLLFQLGEVLIRVGQALIDEKTSLASRC